MDRYPKIKQKKTIFAKETNLFKLKTKTKINKIKIKEKILNI